MAEIINTNMAENLGTTLAGTVGAFKFGVESNGAVSLERIKTCENNAVTYRSMLESDSYTFEQKREIRGWLEEECGKQEAIDEKRHERDQETLGVLATLGVVATVTIVSIVDPLAAKKVSKRAIEFIPKVLKGFKELKAA